jgi:membrane protein required for colicin V production
MNAFDAAIILVGLLLFFYGALKGVARILIGIATLVLAFLLAAWFGGVAGSLSSGFISSEEIRRLLGFSVVFFGVIVAGALIGWLVVKTLAAAHLRWADRLVGGLAGLLATVLLFGALSVPLAAYLPREANLLQKSLLAPYVVRLSSAIVLLVPERVRTRFREGRSQLEKAWREQLKQSGA